MDQAFLQRLSKDTEELKAAGLFKAERVIRSQQQADLQLADGSEVVNFCANNYLGLANHPALIEAAHAALDRYGFGMASVRFICGTQSVHKELEERISGFLGTEETILYPSCFDANGGLKPCKAQRFRYRNNDMNDLEEQLKAAKDARVKLIASDGVFSMDGVIANLQDICDLAEKYGAMVMVDDAHATGFMGRQGRGTHEYRDVMGRVDILTGTLGKALGGAAGGYTAASKEVVGWLRQRSRPYLFSNAIAPVVAAVSIKVLDMLETDTSLRDKLHDNTAYFRQQMSELGFDLVPGEHPIIPLMLGDARLAGRMAELMLDEGIYVVGFSFPVVPKGKARIRTQMSAGHETEHLDRAIAAFAKVGRELAVIS